MTGQDLIYALESSALAYCDSQSTAENERLTIIDDVQSDIQCYIRCKGDKLCITFRGTNSKKDLLTDAAFWKKVVPYGNSGSPIRVHAGFLGAYKTPAVREHLLNMPTEKVKYIRVAGHSYGAALAALCAVDLQYHFPDKDYEVFLFGCPRIGNRAFKTSYNQRVFKTLRVENGNDLVTKIPWALLGYRHIGIPLHIGAPRLPGILSLRQHSGQSYYAHLFARVFF